MKTQLTFIALGALLAATGCSTTVRSLTAAEWIAPPGAGGAAAATPPAGAAAPAAPAAGGNGGIQSQYYVTYWEGSCGFGGCGRGDGHVKRCKVADDNSVTCVDEANATKALSPD